jgi:hypothetical protein
LSWVGYHVFKVRAASKKVGVSQTLSKNIEKIKQGHCPKIELEFPIDVRTGTS